MTEVGRAIQAHTRAIARLIRYLKHPDEAVRSEASDALKGLDPPPTWALDEAVLGSRDRGSPESAEHRDLGPGAERPVAEAQKRDRFVFGNIDRNETYLASQKRLAHVCHLGKQELKYVTAKLRTTVSRLMVCVAVGKVRR